ncbi:MAG: hypothetical protein ACRCYR_11850 [Phycicoccus sp.]
MTLAPEAPLVASVPGVSTPSDVGRLRERMDRMQGGTARRALALHPALTGTVQLRAGGSYQVDGVGLAMALMSGPSRTGSWCAVVGVRDFGVEAAHEVGVDLERTVLVPDPGELWLDVTGALVDVADLVVVRPPGAVTPRVAEKVAARLRTRSSVLVSIGPGPRAELSLCTEEVRWEGPEHGYGQLRSRRVVLTSRRGAVPPRRTPLWFPAPDAAIRRADGPVGTDAGHPSSVPASAAPDGCVPGSAQPQPTEPVREAG